MKTSKFLYILSLVLLLLFVTACKEPDPEDEWRKKTPDYIEELTEYTDIVYDIDEFELSLIRIKVYYTDGASREIPLTEDMLFEEDLDKLLNQHRPSSKVTVFYQLCDEITITIKQTDYGTLDQNLNASGEYGAVIKAIRKDKTIEFIVESTENACAFQFKYTFDNSIMQLSNAIQGSAKGVYSIELTDNSLTALIVLNEAVTNETVLFTVNLEGNFRTSKLKVDDTYDNCCYKKVDNYLTEEIKNVLYHASIK